MEVLALSHLLLFFIMAFGLLIIGRLIEKLVMQKRHGWVRLLVIVPQGLINPFANHRPHEIDLSADLYKRLNELNIPFALETAVHNVGEEIHFYISVPTLYSKTTAQLIESLWSNGYVRTAEDYELWLGNSPKNHGHVSAGYLSQAKPYCVPLKSSHRGHFEPFLGILRHMSNLAAVGEGATIQWVVRKADPHLAIDIGNHLQKFRRGEYHPSRHVHEHFILTPKTIKLLEEKVSSPLFAVNCRIITAATTDTAENLLSHLASHFEAGSTTGDQHNNFKLVKPKQIDRLLDAFLSRRFEPSQEMILTADELATYFHLPGSTTSVPKIKR